MATIKECDRCHQQFPDRTYMFTIELHAKGYNDSGSYCGVRHGEEWCKRCAAMAGFNDARAHKQVHPAETPQERLLELFEEMIDERIAKGGE